MSLAKLLAEAQRRGLIEDDASDSDDRQLWSALVARVTAQVRAGLAPEQLALLDDPCRFRIACCARQCGKTFLVARLMVLTAITAPDRIVVYVSDTFRHAREAMWDDQVDGLPAVLHSLGLEEGGHYRINLSGLRVTFANGSFIELQGADRGAWSGFRGRKIDLVVADEMQRQEQNHLALALSKDVPDCLMMRRGSFVGIGTVGTYLKGVWFELNAPTHGLCDPRPGWTAHHWTARELRHLTPVWDEQLAWCLAMGIDIETDPQQQREKLGRWVRDVETLVHTVAPASLWDGRTYPERVRSRCPTHNGPGVFSCTCDLPTVRRTQEPICYAGFDLGGGEGPGQGDPCAIVVVTVSREEGVIREVHSEQRYVRDSDEMGRWLRNLADIHRIAVFYVDPAWKLQVNDLSRLHGFNAEGADKGLVDGRDEDFWHAERRMALRQGTMRVIEGGILHGQLDSIVRDQEELDRGRIRAAPRQDDHAFDAWRYVFRMIRTNHVKAPEPPMTPMERDFAATEEARRRIQAPQRTPNVSERRPMPRWGR